MKKCGCGGKPGGCLGAPMRALSRACDLYVRGMSGCARRVPSGAAAGVVGRGFGGSGAASLRLRVRSDGADDLVLAASASRWQRRVATVPEGVDGVGNAARQRRVAPVEAVDYGAGKKGGAAVLISAAPPAFRVPVRKKAGAAAMGTITEDAPCEFGLDGACVAVPSPKPPRPGGFGAVKQPGSEVFAR